MRDNVSKLLQVKNKTDTNASIYIYGEIVSDSFDAWLSEDTYPEQIKRCLDGLNGQELHIYINSVGGAVFAGMAIFNQLCRYKGKKIVHIDGVAASIASVIAMAGDEIYVPSNAMLMIHRASLYAGGNAADMERYAEILKDIDANILKTYADRLKNPADIDEIKRLMEEETYLTAEEAAAYFRGITVTAPLQIAAKAENAKIHYALMREAAAVDILRLKGEMLNG